VWKHFFPDWPIVLLLMPHVKPMRDVALLQDMMELDIGIVTNVPIGGP
jgi:hypothetical protein